MPTVAPPKATLDDLYRTKGKAELIGGRIVHFMPTGDAPSQIAANIYRNLYAFAKKLGKGVAYTDNMGFAVKELRSGRESFSPDAAYYVGPRSKNRMWFVEGAPTFAVEVRSESDYVAAAEKEMAQKRQDYFEAGTLVVWDVDTNEECIRVYRPSDPEKKTTYRKGELAEAEPALPGWTIAVDEVFEMI